MKLAIDIGNTNINMGVFKGSVLLRRYCLSSSEKKRLSDLKKIILYNNIKDVIICSVVPHVTGILERGIKKVLGKDPYIIGKGLKVPIKNLYRRPSQVGSDRLVNAYAGVRLYGAPLVVVDFGTAVTFDIISRKREYLGGLILPGLAISLEALHQRTALLPRVNLGEPKEFIGRDTKNSMLSGVIHGFAALNDNLAVKIKDKVGKDALLIGTGGNISLISKFCKQLNRVDKDLTLKGLNMLLPA